MSASVASVAQASPPRSTPTRDPPRLQILSAILTLVLVSLLLLGGEALRTSILAEWKSLAFWAGLVMLVSLFPIKIDDALLTLDEPILLAVALLYPPEVAAVVAISASVDVREFKGQIVFARALYNRAQVGLSIYLAGAAFRAVTGGTVDPWPTAMMGTAAAVVAEYCANVFLVSLHARVRWKLDLPAAMKKLKVGDTGYLATHLGYGTFALVLAHLSYGVGVWSVATFVVPILVARQMLMRGEAIKSLDIELRERDRLLERVSDRILDERRDERRRVAGELHDDVLQSLTQIWLSARLVEEQQQSEESVRDGLRELVAVVETSSESLRRVIHNLRDSPAGLGDLIPNLRGLVRDLRRDWKANIELHLPDSLELATATQVVVYQIVREGLINSLKHAGAARVTVELQVADRRVTALVEDDGVGFSLEGADPVSHFGVELMNERARSVGGVVQVTSARNQGTRVTATFPERENFHGT